RLLKGYRRPSDTGSTAGIFLESKDQTLQESFALAIGLGKNASQVGVVDVAATRVELGDGMPDDNLQPGLDAAVLFEVQLYRMHQRAFDGKGVNRLFDAQTDA